VAKEERKDEMEVNTMVTFNQSEQQGNNAVIYNIREVEADQEK